MRCVASGLGESDAMQAGGVGGEQDQLMPSLSTGHRVGERVCSREMMDLDEGGVGALRNHNPRQEDPFLGRIAPRPYSLIDAINALSSGPNSHRAREAQSVGPDASPANGSGVPGGPSGVAPLQATFPEQNSYAHAAITGTYIGQLGQ
eukprot:1085963-Rhodomonas_salina.1